MAPTAARSNSHLKEPAIHSHHTRTWNRPPAKFGGSRLRPNSTMRMFATFSSSSSTKPIAISTIPTVASLRYAPKPLSRSGCSLPATSPRWSRRAATSAGGPAVLQRSS